MHASGKKERIGRISKGGGQISAGASYPWRESGCRNAVPQKRDASSVAACTRGTQTDERHRCRSRAQNGTRLVGNADA